LTNNDKFLTFVLGGKMKLYRIIYISKVNTELDQNALFDLCCSSEEKNTKIGISGILITSEKHFIQALEGPWDKVNDLYHTIVSDPRHKELRIISYECVCKRDFPIWTMKVFSPFDHKGITNFVISKYGLDKTEFKFPVEKNNAFAFLLDVYKYFQNDFNLDCD
jgi:Sensors of blue-light using FAD